MQNTNKPWRNNRFIHFSCYSLQAKKVDCYIWTIIIASYFLKATFNFYHFIYLIFKQMNRQLRKYFFYLHSKRLISEAELCRLFKYNIYMNSTVYE